LTAALPSAASGLTVSRDFGQKIFISTRSASDHGCGLSPKKGGPNLIFDRPRISFLDGRNFFAAEILHVV
jgi:hypothetical protein